MERILLGMSGTRASTQADHLELFSHRATLMDRIDFATALGFPCLVFNIICFFKHE